MFIFIGILAFGLLIAIHELGHFVAAKLLDIRVNEFAIGMGPKLISKQGKETLYSLRALPFGGFCSMAEDELIDDDAEIDPRAFNAKARWKRVVVLLSGGFANLVAAFIIVLIITSGADGFGGTTIAHLLDDFPNKGADGLMVGDTIVSINGERLFYSEDFLIFMDLNEHVGVTHVDLVIRRGDERISLNNFPLYRREFIINGQPHFRFGISFNSIEATPFEVVRHSFYSTFNNIRLIRVSLVMLISGPFGVRDMGGPVAIVDAMNTIGQQAPTFTQALTRIASFTAFIGVNLAVVNLLPIPALDGGRILLIIISWVVEKITRRKLDPKYEAYINSGTFILLLGFIVFILINDVLRIVHG